jgi:hypothetical protein
MITVSGHSVGSSQQPAASQGSGPRRSSDSRPGAQAFAGEHRPHPHGQRAQLLQPGLRGGAVGKARVHPELALWRIGQQGGDEFGLRGAALQGVEVGEVEPVRGTGFAQDAGHRQRRAAAAQGRVDRCIVRALAAPGMHHHAAHHIDHRDDVHPASFHLVTASPSVPV